MKAVAITWLVLLSIKATAKLILLAIASDKNYPRRYEYSRSDDAVNILQSLALITWIALTIGATQ